MTFQDLFSTAVILTIAVCAYLFRDGGPGTPKRIKIPISRPSSW